MSERQILPKTLFQTTFLHNVHMPESLRQMQLHVTPFGPNLVSRWAPWEIGRILVAVILLGSGLIACTTSTEEPAAEMTAAVPAANVTAATASAYEPDMVTFETVWKTVADGFYDANMNGIDWLAIHDLYKPQVAAASDEESYYRLMNSMLFELGVSHIGLLPPSMADELEPITFLPGSLGLDVRLLGGQMVITSVQPDSPAANAGLRPGYVVEKVNGLTPQELAQDNLPAPPLNDRHRRGKMADAVRVELYGQPGQQVTISFLDDLDQAAEVTLAYATRAAKQTQISPDLPPAFVEFSAHKLSSEIGYIRLSGFLPGVEEDFSKAIDEMEDTQALIVDIRGNPGGVFPVRKAIAEKLVGEHVLFWQYQQRDQLRTVYLDAIASAYPGDVLILIDELSASSSEEFAGGLQALGRAIVVGGRSPGNCLVMEIFPLEYGATLIYPFGQSQTPDGHILEGNGVIPDVEVELDRASLLAGRDLQLEAAVVAASD